MNACHYLPVLPNTLSKTFACLKLPWTVELEIDLQQNHRRRDTAKIAASDSVTLL